MSQHDEDLVAYAGAKTLQWIALASTAAEALTQLTAMRRQAAAERNSRQAAAMRADLQARYVREAMGWRAMLDPKLRADSDVTATAQAWAAAQAWRGDPEADQAGRLAEDQLRTLRPDAMRVYDRALADGADPIAAMREAAPFLDRQPGRPGDPAPVKPQLDGAADAKRAAVDLAAGRPAAAAAADVWERQPQPSPERQRRRLRIVEAEVVRSVSVRTAESYLRGSLAAAGAAEVAAAAAVPPVTAVRSIQGASTRQPRQ